MKSDTACDRSMKRKEKNEYRKLPEPIADATPEQVAKAIMKAPPKKEWRFMQKNQKIAQSD